MIRARAGLFRLLSLVRARAGEGARLRTEDEDQAIVLDVGRLRSGGERLWLPL